MATHDKRSEHKLPTQKHTEAWNYKSIENQPPTDRQHMGGKGTKVEYPKKKKNEKGLISHV